MNLNIRLLPLLICIPLCIPIQAQELEPRSLTNLPVGMNFAVAGYAWTQGNILLDPAISIEDLNADMHGLVIAYLRAINFFGLSGKVDAILPMATGNWRGIQLQEYKTTSRTGIGDPKIRFSVNFLGAPALSMEEFRSYTQKSIFC